MNIYIRPLQLEDAETSWRWRNDPEVWRFTARRPDRHITPEIERDWLVAVLQETNSRRFAIVVSEDGSDTYVGNVQLTDIAEGSGQMHTLLGDRRYWGRGIATRAVSLLLQFAFQELRLDVVRARVHPDHRASIRLKEKNRFSIIAHATQTEPDNAWPFVVMEITRDAFEAAQSKPARLLPAQPN